MERQHRIHRDRNLNSSTCIALAALTAMGLLTWPTPAGAQELRLRYTFDEPSGDALDVSGFAPAANASFSGGSTRTANTPGQFSARALDLTGTGSRYVATATDADKIDGLLNYTFTTWLNLQGTPAITDRLFVDIASSTEGSLQLLFVNPGSGALSASSFRLQLTVGDNSQPVADKVISQDINADNQWVFLAATIDGVNKQGQFFLGGVNSPVVAIGNGALNQGFTQNFAPFVVGGSGFSFLDATPPALLDDLRVYNGVADLAFLDTVRVLNVPEPTTGLLLAMGTLIIGFCFRSQAGEWIRNRRGHEKFFLSGAE